jgi:hypothetical protein
MDDELLSGRVTGLATGVAGEDAGGTYFFTGSEF